MMCSIAHVVMLRQFFMVIYLYHFFLLSYGFGFIIVPIIIIQTNHNKAYKVYNNRINYSSSFQITKKATTLALSSRQQQKKHNNNNNDAMSQYNNHIKQNTINLPIPMMPSILFQQLTLSQLELLSSALLIQNSGSGTKISKIRSIALYLPQENKMTGQLEFTPAIVYPNPINERIFIANDANSGMAPTLPKKLTVLPGFAHATTLLPAYPMVSTNTIEPGVGIVEEFLCDIRLGGITSLSVPLLCGSQTVGVLLITPAIISSMRDNDTSNKGNKKSNNHSFWTIEDRQMVAKVAKSLSLALSMDTERNELQVQNEVVYESLSDSIHQFKNPLQALRTFGKLLQQRIAHDKEFDESLYRNSPQILELTQHLIVQSDRLVERLKPVDTIVETLGERRRPLAALSPVNNNKAIVPWRTPYLLQEDEDDASTSSISIRRDKKQRGKKTSSSFIKNDSLDTIRNETDTYSIATTSSTNTNMFDMSYENLVRKDDQSKSLTNNDNMNNENIQNDDNEVKYSSSDSKSSFSIITNCDLQMCFIMDIVEPILSTFQAIANERGILLTIEEIDELPGITICSEALEEALNNILDNAMKYVILGKSGSKNGNPHVHIRLLPNHKPVATGVTILIEDNGPGIVKEERTKVFERGYRSKSITTTTIESESSSIPGSGIGLYLARCMIEEMGGSISIVDPTFYNNALDGTIVQIVLFR